MASHRYEQVCIEDPHESYSDHPPPPSPSFEARHSSDVLQHRHRREVPTSSIEGILEDTFNDSDLAGGDMNATSDRERLIRDVVPERDDPALYATSNAPGSLTARRAPLITTSSVKSSQPNDGVFANLSAKPESGEKAEEQPPSYEQAAADATPPYWETTILAPGMMSDEIYIDGLPVGFFFSFAWNAIISMAFQLVGFLLTYLLHTTHAAKNGSRAGLGVTLINYGFSLRSISSRKGGPSDPFSQKPANPDSHDFDPSTASAAAATMSPPPGDAPGVHPTGQWISYLLMVVGWIVLIKAVTDFIKARRHERLILQSPDREAGGSLQDANNAPSIV